MSKEKELLYEKALMKWGLVMGYSFVTTREGYLETYDRFKQKMESDNEFYNKVVKELNQNKDE